MIMVLAPEKEDAASPSCTYSGTGNELAATHTPLPGKEPQVLLGGLLPQPVSSGIAWVQPGEGQQFPELNSQCLCPSRDIQL